MIFSFQSPTHEENFLIFVRELAEEKTLQNLQWLIPLALDEDALITPIEINYRNHTSG